MGKEIKTGTEFRPLDFCGNADLVVKAFDCDDDDERATVIMTAGRGGCHFQWSMTANGARAMASMLIKAANEATVMVANKKSVQE